MTRVYTVPAITWYASSGTGILSMIGIACLARVVNFINTRLRLVDYAGFLSLGGPPNMLGCLELRSPLTIVNELYSQSYRESYIYKRVIMVCRS